MAPQSFRFAVLAGHNDKFSSFDIDLADVEDLENLKKSIGGQFGVVQPEGLSFEDSETGSDIENLDDMSNAKSVLIKVDGAPLQEVPLPAGLPMVGNYYQIFPDHLGNHQRLFEKHGPIFRENIMGAVVTQTNDPRLAGIVFAETEFFSKDIIPGHPLYPIKNQHAGVFLGDTHREEWKLAHKYLPPALGPKAVRHYATQMNDCIAESWPVFDELESKNDAWNVYQFMLKLSSGTVGKIMLGKDFEHFTSVDAPLHRIVLAIAETLAINKKVASHGAWYSYLPFGDPKRLKDLQHYTAKEIQASIDEAKSNGEEDLPMQDAALKAANVIDYLTRAVDSNGNRLPQEQMVAATLVAAGAGFTTTSSLLSWCIYSLVTYPGLQARLLQEMVDHGLTDETMLTADHIEELTELNKFIKETQRKHNPSYQPGRTAQKDLILPGGYMLKKNDIVIPAIHHIHNNPKLWENPARFDMDRWDTDRVKGMDKNSYVPFATGQRMCIGFNFALLEVKIFMAKLVYRYHWDKDTDVETEYDPFFQLIRPVNLYVKTTKREEYPSKSNAASMH